MRTICLAAILLASCALASADFAIVQGGRAQCQIVLGKGAQPVEKQAAEDLARCLQVMTGVQVPLVDEGLEKAGVPRVLVGPCALSDETMEAVGVRDYGGYIIRQVGPDLVLRGPSEYGSSNAVYGLLEDTLRLLARDDGGWVDAATTCAPDPVSSCSPTNGTSPPCR